MVEVWVSKPALLPESEPIQCQYIQAIEYASQSVEITDQDEIACLRAKYETYKAGWLKTSSKEAVTFGLLSALL